MFRVRDGEEPVRAKDTKSFNRKLGQKCVEKVCVALLLHSVLFFVSAAMLYPALLCAALLLLAPLENTEARALHTSPDAVQFMEQFLERYNDLLTLDDLENLLNSRPEEPLTGGVKSAEYPKWGDVQTQAETPWLRLLKGALASQKRAEPDRSRRGWNRGCFGLKLDRIGSMSGLGC
ncbi:hypothetical protein LDENG_00050220 [Lucifuga dentata]|nr:hypothetical protein LDENG_00050220 [Lucifuga dentata]